jgi:flavin reductase (DIM6/NTAB) family NADH-FMN oxidoreductase RutF
MASFDPAQLTHAEQYKLLAGSVIPRPIALVTTQGPHGPNAAPFSFFNVLGVEPPMLMFSVGARAGADKDTVRNLREVPEMVVHLVDEASSAGMNLCSGPYPPDVNELELAGFQSVPSDLVRPPRIASCPVQFECVLEQMTPFGTVPYNLVIARVVRMHFRAGLVNAAFHVDMQALNPVGRVAGPGMYTRVTDIFQLESLL